MSRDLSYRPGFLIRRLHQIHLALFAEECAGFRVTPVQFSIMTVLAARPEQEQIRLGEAIGVDRATLANVLARLEKRGLISRTASPKDARMKQVSLTAQGTEILEAMETAAARAHDRTVAALPAAEQARFLGSLRQLVDAGNDFGRAPLKLE